MVYWLKTFVIIIFNRRNSIRWSSTYLSVHGIRWTPEMSHWFSVLQFLPNVFFSRWAVTLNVFILFLLWRRISFPRRIIWIFFPINGYSYLHEIWLENCEHPRIVRCRVLEGRGSPFIQKQSVIFFATNIGMWDTKWEVLIETFRIRFKINLKGECEG